MDIYICFPILSGKYPGLNNVKIVVQNYVWNSM